MDENNDFEKFSGTAEVSGEQIARAAEWENAMGSGVPEFQGEEAKFGVAHEGNDYCGEAVSGDRDVANSAADGSMESGSIVESGSTASESASSESVSNRAASAPSEEYNSGITDAAALVNYGLNAAARDLGVETVVQKLKGFDASGREDPIKDFFEYLGVDTPEEHKEVRDEASAAAISETVFKGGVNGAVAQRKSAEGAFRAIKDMKELISEVEGADPRYEELRAGARAAGKGYFEYAVSGYGVRGLVELFQVLATQREKHEEDQDQGA